MTAQLRLLSAVAGLLLLAACSNDTTEPPPPPLARCRADITPVSLAPGAFAAVDPSVDDGCVQLPGAATTGSEYVYVAVATAADSTPYSLRAGNAPLLSAGAGPGVALLSPSLAAFTRPSPAGVFHSMLRSREAGLARIGVPFLAAPPIAPAPPVEGDQRTFSVCASTTCTSYVSVTATARHVGQRVAIYLDDTVPAGGYTQADIDSVGSLFDQYLYPIDTTAFGRESDLDNNGVVVVLMTDAVNKLSGSCPDQSVILGYFFGADLVPTSTGSNKGEIFYSLVPDPTGAVAGCDISKDFANRVLGPTFIHEFQHMISFNQHVLIKKGLTEETWLNEGLSHFAEELGGRQIPDAAGSPTGSRFTQFLFGDVQNAYSYLMNAEGSSLVEANGSTGTLDERGANWLFVRWLVDQFGVAPLGTTFTRSLLATNQVGVTNVEGRTGEGIDALLVQWQLANYLDNLPGFTPASPRLQYSSWNFRNTFGSLNSQDPQDFPLPYPLVPDTAATTEYARSGALRLGSGPHVLVEQSSGSQGYSLQLVTSAGGVLPVGAAARAAVARIR